MATTIPTEFIAQNWHGAPTISMDKIDTLKEWYRSTLADSDKADTPEDESWYIGQALAYESALRLLHDMPMEDK